MGLTVEFTALYAVPFSSYKYFTEVHVQMVLYTSVSTSCRMNSHSLNKNQWLKIRGAIKCFGYMS